MKDMRIFALLLGTALIFGACSKEDPQPTPERLPVPTEIGFTETGSTIIPDSSDCWEWSWWERPDFNPSNPAEVLISFIEKGRLRAPYPGNAYPFYAWGASQPQGNVLNNTVSTCNGQEIGIVLNVFTDQGDPEIKPNHVLGMFNGFALYRTWYGGRESHGLMTGTIGGKPAIVAVCYPFGNSTFNLDQPAFFVGIQQ